MQITKKSIALIMEVLFGALVLISLFGACNTFYSEFLILSYKKTAILFILIAFILVFFYKKNIKIFLFRDKSQLLIAIVVMIIVIFWQCNMIYVLRDYLFWDPRILINTFYGHFLQGKDYYSFFPNNLWTLTLEKCLFNLTGRPNFKNFEWILSTASVISVDMGIIFTSLSSRRLFNKNVGFFTFIILTVLMGLSPHIVIFYTDTLSFCFVSLFLYLYSLFKVEKKSLKMILSILLGLNMAFIYQTKPSSIIVVLSLVLVTLYDLDNWPKRKNIKGIISRVLLVCFAFIISITGMGYLNNHNGYVHIDNTKRMSMFHFMAMGSTGNGGFNYSIASKEWTMSRIQRKNFELKTIRENLLSSPNLATFYVQKQINNTADSTWDAVAEGTSSIAVVTPKKQKNLGCAIKKDKHLNLIQNFQLHTYYGNNSKNWDGYNIYIQLIWCITLLFTLLSVGENEFRVSFLKLSILGGFLFLLIFEGGRSRYLIQFLPTIGMLSAVMVNKYFAVRQQNNESKR